MSCLFFLSRQFVMVDAHVKQFATATSPEVLGYLLRRHDTANAEGGQTQSKQ